MKLLKLLTVLLITTCMFNCSSDDSVNQPQNQQQEENLRLKIYGINSQEFSLGYNSNGLLSSYHNSFNSASLVYNSDDKIIQMGEYSYTYNSLGQIASITGQDDDNVTFVYNNQGLIAVCYISFPLSGSIKHISREFEYNSNNQLISVTEIDTEDSTYWQNLITYDSNGNVAQVVIQYGADGTNYIHSDTLVYNYDDKKNPGYETLKKTGISTSFSPLSLYPLYSFSTGSYVYFRAFYYSPNNLLSTQSNSYTLTYDYVYNDEGFPISCERTSSSGTTTYYNWIYETY